MKYLLLFLLGTLTTVAAFSQTPEDLKKMQDSMMKQMQQFEKAMKQMGNGLPPQQGKPNTKSLPHSVQEGKEKLPLPPRNNKLLAKIPAKTMTRTELMAYIADLQKKLQLQKNNTKAIATAKTKMARYAVSSHETLAFLFFSRKEYVSSLWVYCAVVKANPANLNALNNLAAVLNHVGFPHKSIPLSKHVLTAASSSAAVNNNMGQAYFRLGDIDNAIRFLSAATSLSPYHVEANATQGYINEARGNTQAATQQYRNSMQGGYNQVAAEGMKRTVPDADLSKMIRTPPKERYPEMDDNLPFACPVFPGGGYAAAEKFNAQQVAEAEAWRIAADEYEERAGQALSNSAMNLIRAQQGGQRLGFRVSPFFHKAQLIIAKSYQNYMEDSHRYQEEFDKWREAFTKRWTKQIDDACNDVKTTECCAIQIRLYDQRNQEYMSGYHKYCENMWKAARWHYNTVCYWYPVVKSVPLAAKDLVGARSILLHTASSLSQVQIEAFTCDRPVDRELSAEKDPSFNEPDCPFSINIPLGVGDVSLSCESFSVDMGEGIVGGFEYEFESGQTTVYMGLGVQAELGVLSVEASATQYICFDSNFNVTDIGNIASAEASVMDISPTLGISGASAEANVTFSVNDGLSMSFQESVLGQSIVAGEIQLL